MSAPLSPLPSSHQNSRAQTPNFHPPSKSGPPEEIMTEDHQENPQSSPFKIATEEEDAQPQDDLVYSSARQSAQNTDDDEDAYQDPPSSPFQYSARDDTVDLPKLRERQSLAVSEHSTTPRKRSYEYDHTQDGAEVSQTPDDRSKRGVGQRDIPDINVYADEDPSPTHEHSMTEHAGHGIGTSMMEEKHNEGMSTVLHGDNAAEDKENMDSNGEYDVMIDDSHDPMDDTCLSTFSAVLNVEMTAFAKLRQDSPIKAMRPSPSSPARLSEADRSAEPCTPSTARRPYRRSALIDVGSPVGSPTPRRREYPDAGNPSQTPNLIDLMDQPSLFPRRSNMQSSRYSPRRSPLRTVRESMKSPAKGSLLDFDISPAPTPRSIPTITPRELESLKSGFMSEISSLKATLSGREAEVSSLKQAIADAERRVGEAWEEVRNESARKEALEMEQSEWQRRGQEMEEVLRSVKADIVEGEQERERLIKKVEEVEKSKERLEGQVVELESRLSAGQKSPTGESATRGDASNTNSAEQTAKEVQEAVEKVARELHTLYKGKHETKVSALKKSYEARWEKRVRQAEDKLKAVNEENDRLKTERNSTMPKTPDPNASMIAHEKDEHEAEKRVMEAQIKGLQQEMATIKANSEQLRLELKAERAEKGELVAAVDEWLAMQQPQSQPQRAGSESHTPRDGQSPEPTSADSDLPVENFKRSIGRSGIRPPSTGSSGGERKIPKVGIPTPGKPARGNSGGKSGIAVFTPGRSGIMGSIERMGRGG